MNKFNLHVEFSGPSLFVLNKNGNGDTTEVHVLMPDARRVKHPDPKFLDGTPGEHHVGFVRLDIADMHLPYPIGAKEAQPKYELVHRFTEQVLDFGSDVVAEPIKGLDKLQLPNFDAIAGGTVEPFPDLLGPNPPSQLLMRTTLRGGTFESDPKSIWRFSTVLNPTGQRYVGEFASDVTWKREIVGDRLTIAVKDFKGNPEAELPLGPFKNGDTLTLVVGNLCAFNPLDWDDLPRRQVTKFDWDFKWLYQLLRTKGASKLVFPEGSELPAPELVKVLSGETGDEACMGGRITV